MRLGLKVRLFASIAAASAAMAVVSGTAALAQAPVCSVWLIESSRFMKVPFGSFMPDRAFVPGSDKPNQNIPTVDLPVNVGVIKCGTDLILYDTGWKQQDYLKMTGSDHWAPIADQLKVLGFSANDVTKAVIGHAHWDHAGQLSDLPNAVRISEANPRGHSTVRVVTRSYDRKVSERLKPVNFFNSLGIQFLIIKFIEIREP
jgi:glyoxylase-like metal-dependent hydrolase (beta-lactamase superfamily II)